MANKKIKTKPATTPKLKNTRRRKLLKIVLIIVGLFVVLGTVDTLVKAVKLSASGKKLNEIQTQIQISGLDVSLYRDRYCWRTQEKFANGSRICDQRLIIIGKNKPVEAQKTEIKNVVQVIEGVTNEKIDSEPLMNYSDAGVSWTSLALLRSKPTITSCIARYMAFDGGSTDQLSSGTYALDISCSENVLTINIYRALPDGRYSWEWYTGNEQ